MLVVDLGLHIRQIDGNVLFIIEVLLIFYGSRKWRLLQVPRVPRHHGIVSFAFERHLHVVGQVEPALRLVGLEGVRNAIINRVGIIQFALIHVCIVGVVGVGPDARLHRPERLQPLTGILQALLPQNACALHLEMWVKCPSSVGVLQDLGHQHGGLCGSILHLPLLRFTRAVIFQSRLIRQNEVRWHVSVALLGLLAVWHTKILILGCPYFTGSDRSRRRWQLR